MTRDEEVVNWRDLPTDPAATVEVGARSLREFMRAAEALERQAHCAQCLLREVWDAALGGDVLLDGELAEGLRQYREEYGPRWPEGEE